MKVDNFKHSFLFFGYLLDRSCYKNLTIKKKSSKPGEVGAILKFEKYQNSLYVSKLYHIFQVEKCEN
jgi:hypothetical protein